MGMSVAEMVAEGQGIVALADDVSQRSPNQSKQKIGVWGNRFRAWRDEYKLTDDQLDMVMSILSETSAFGYNHIEASARAQLEAIKGDA